MTQDLLGSGEPEPIEEEVEVPDYPSTGEAKPEELTTEELDRPIGSGPEKEEFEKAVRLNVDSVRVMRSPKISVDTQGGKYQPIYIQIACSGKIDGKDVETVDNYGGIREYVENHNVWIGEKSDAAKLKNKLLEYLGKTTVNFKDFKNLEDMEVQLRTETREFDSRVTKKNVITAIIGE